MSGLDYARVFGGGLLILLVAYSPVAALGAATGRFIRRLRERAKPEGGS